MEIQMESALRSLILTRIILMESTPNQDSKTKAGVAWSSTINSFPVGLSPPLPPPKRNKNKKNNNQTNYFSLFVFNITTI